ncbi:MAG: DUF4055 domain-containing protein [Herbaspirillum sp.]
MTLKVNQPSAAVAAMSADLVKIDALMGGTMALRAAGERYLPKWPMEDQKSYDFRLKTSTLYNAFARTIENMAGKPFIEPVKWTDVDPIVEEWFDNFDLCGRNLHVFAQDVFRHGLKDGLTHVLVDYPPTVDETGAQLYKTKSEEATAGVRPYAIHIKQSQILGFISTFINGAETLTQVRILESVDEPDGDFGTKSVSQVRVLTPGAWQTYRKAPTSDDWLLDKEGSTSLDFIPLATFYTRRTGFMTATPPLNDLADLNIKHWQSSSDQDSILHVARVPILAISGVNDDTKIEVGAKSALMLPIGATVQYVEHTGAAISAGRDSIEDLQSQMESMGAELLIVRPGARTATETAIDTAQSQCQLSAMVESFEDFLDQTVDTMATWVGLPDQGDIDVFDDFATVTIGAATVAPFVTALVLLVNSGLMSRESAFEELKRYGVTNPDGVWEDEQERIQNSPPDLTGTPTGSLTGIVPPITPISKVLQDDAE